MALKIYTKTGDAGKTSLMGGTRVSKSALRLETYGTVDELNSYMGWVADYQSEASIIELIREIQDRLFTIGSALAVDPGKSLRMELPRLENQDIVLLEKAIDAISEQVPPMRNFILPGGALPISICHVARCICRRAERLCVSLAEKEGSPDPLILAYLNRLSDYLFMLARYTAHRLHVDEILWKPRI